jgi:hypothetical protein
LEDQDPNSPHSASCTLYGLEVFVRFAYRTVPSLKILGLLIPSINRVCRGEGVVDAENLVGTEDPSVGTERDLPKPPGTGGGTGIKEDVPEAPGMGVVVVVSWSLTGVEAPSAPVAALICGHETPRGFGTCGLLWAADARWMPMIGCTGTEAPAGDA